MMLIFAMRAAAHSAGRGSGGGLRFPDVDGGWCSEGIV
jgi:hypothetical protein